MSKTLTKSLTLNPGCEAKLLDQPHPLRVEPNALNFENIEPGTLYVVTFSIRNLSTVSHRIRIDSPKTDIFALNYIPSGTVAPGLDIRAEVECQIPSSINELQFNDLITIYMGPYKTSIPLFASKPHAIIEFNSLANFGFVAVGQTASIDVDLKNTGTATGSITFKISPQSPLRFSANKIDISPKSTEKISIYLDGKTVGTYREAVQLIIDKALSNSILDVTAQIVDQRLSLMSEDKSAPLDFVNFGTLYYGQKKSMTAYLVNSGPQTLSFVISYPVDSELNPTALETPSLGVEDPSLEKRLVVSPTEGQIRPFSDFPLQVTFSPEISPPPKGFTKSFISEINEPRTVSRRASIETLENGHRLLASFSGTVVRTNVTMTPSNLRFGSCPVHDRRDILVSLENHSELPTPFEFPRIPQFKILPSKGLLQPKETKPVVASFLPNQLGEFKGAHSLCVAEGLSFVDFTVLGVADLVGPKKPLLGGTDKLPSDFKSGYKFVDPVEIEEWRLTRKYPNKDKTGPKIEKDLLSATSSHERDQIYFDRSLDDPASLAEDHPWKTRRDNNKTYNDFLTKQRMQREGSRKKQPDTDLFGPDMGMSRSLPEPSLPLPPSGEPLWLANRVGEDGDSNGRNRIPLDENRLIVKKHSAIPATQAEMKDCTMELGPDELKLVSCSHKILDFGRVCVGSLVTKNFVVVNDISHSIHIKIDGFEPEMKQSRPEAQVVPKMSIAGFDIHFTSKTLGKYKKTFSWTINQKHVFKVTAKAEVVPIELQLSQKHVVMEFPSDSLESSMSQDVVLSNKGNASAEFLWGTSTGFKCRPEKGVIGPGQTCVISILWIPSAGKRCEEELGLHIPGGVDQTLTVEGLLKEAKAEFEEKKLNLGTFAVGLEKKMVIHIKNIGANPTAFFLNSLDPKFGVAVLPEKGLLQAGETAALSVIINATSAISYENVMISASVRGGKSIGIRLLGESILPQFSLAAASNFTFGPVPVGGEVQRPLSVSNNSPIPASLVLDLSSYPDFKPKIGASFPHPYTPSYVMTDVQGNKIEMMMADLSSTVATAISRSDASGGSKHGHARSLETNLWKITIGPGSTLEAFLLFAPSSPFYYSFNLPLFIMGIPSDISVSREVLADALPNRLEISNRAIEFGDRVVSRDPLARETYYLEFSFKNVDTKKGLTYYIKSSSDVSGLPPDEDPAAPTFFISPVKGDLASGGTCQIRVTFMPRSSGDFFKTLDVFISDQPDSSRPYMTLICKGSGVYPRLTFSKYFIQLPTVPLNVSSRATFFVHNHGYASLNMMYRISPAIPVPLSISFPEGSEVSTALKTVRAVITAKSDTPVSWSGKIEFYDSDGDRFSIFVCGCSDNSILTNFPFIRSYSDSYSFIGLDEQPCMFLRKSEVLELRTLDAKRKELIRKQRLLERQKSAETMSLGTRSSEKKEKKKQSGSVGDETLESIQTSRLGDDLNEGINVERAAADLSFTPQNEMEVRFLLKWLNKNVVKHPFDPSTFPYCILDTYGDLVVDCIELMSGKRLAGVTKSSLLPADSDDRSTSSNGPTLKRRSSEVSADFLPSVAISGTPHMQAIQRILAKYQAMLTFLIRSGALLNHIQAMSLLSFDDHLLIQETEARKAEGSRLTSARYSEMKAVWEQNWFQNCQAGWAEVLFQCVKVFVLSRVNHKDFLKMPGVLLTSKEDVLNPVVHESKSKEKEGAKGKKKGPSLPPEIVGSNVYSTSESVLLMWANYHIQRAVSLKDSGAEESGNRSALFGLSKRVVDFENEFKDFFGFCQLFHSHLPQSTAAEDAPLFGYTMIDRSGGVDEISSKMRRVASMTRLEINASDEEIVASSRTVLLFILHLFLGLPCFIPKTTIEFRGDLGSPIGKTIELKNPSRKPVQYDVTLKGSSDFSTPLPFIIIPPESSIDFTIFLNARFSVPVSAEVTFWGTREAGVAGATMVFLLQSVITGRQPIETIKRTISLFELDTFTLTVRSPLLEATEIPLKLYFQYSPRTVEESIKGINRPKELKTAAFSSVLLHSPSKAKVAGQEEGAPEVATEEAELEKLFINPLWCPEEVIELRPNEPRSLTFHALSFKLGVHLAQLVFLDPKQGEFCYDILLDVVLPKPVEKLDFSALVTKENAPVTKALRIASKNAVFEKAIQTLTDMRLSHPARKAKCRALLYQYLASSVVDDSNQFSIFNIELLSPYFTCPKSIPFVSEYSLSPLNQLEPILPPEKKMLSPRSKEKGLEHGKKKTTSKTIIDSPSSTELANLTTTPNTTFISFIPQQAGKHQLRAVAFSKSNPQDIRVIDISCTVTMPDCKMAIEFNGASRQRVTQELPIVNRSSKDWTLAATITGRGFTGPRTLIVPKNDKAIYPLTFCGPFSGSFDGGLVLRTVDGDDSFQYTLIGVAGDPLAEDHLHFKCKARTKHEFSIPLQQVPKAAGPKSASSHRLLEKKKLEESAGKKPEEVQRFLIETDIPYLIGRPFVDVSQAGGIYDFSIFCPIGGRMSGSITFIDVDSGSMIWYTMDVDVTSPAAERTIEVEALVRKAVAVEISLDNPTKNTLEFSVTLEGEGLLGDNFFVLPPESVSRNAEAGSPSYELIFSPLIPGQSIGKISFLNDKVGEFWYRLNLSALPAPPTIVDPIESMIGSSGLAVVPVENPLPEHVTLSVQVSDPEHFSVIPENITLGPYSQTSFQLLFRPSNLTDLVRGTVKLSHPNFGEVDYHVSGRATLPGNMPLTQMYAPLEEIGSYTIPFRNPFPHPLPVNIVLCDQSLSAHSERPVKKDQKPKNQQPVPLPSNAFSLLLKKATDLVIPAKSTFQISISFSPTRLGQYSSHIEVRSTVAGRSLLWCFPLLGMAESGAAQELPKLITPCKTTIFRDIDIHLDGLFEADLESTADLEPSNFSIETVVSDPKCKSLVQRSFRAQPVEILRSDPASSPSLPDFLARYRLLFEPLRTFECSIELILSCRNKGRWKAKFELVASDPEPDDRIVLTAPVKGVDKVSFRLSNRFLGYSSFQAYFIGKSSQYFTITPASGVLAAFGSEGTQFVIAYSRAEYGTIDNATLVIKTDEAQWNYEVIGNFPNINVNSNAKSKIHLGRSIN